MRAWDILYILYDIKIVLSSKVCKEWVTPAKYVCISLMLSVSKDRTNNLLSFGSSLQSVR